MPPRPGIDLTPVPLKPATDRQICLYIAEMCTELRRLARRKQLGTLRYLLDMARLEAERTGKDLMT